MPAPTANHSQKEQDIIDAPPLLDAAGVTVYRSCAMRMKHLDQDRMDLSEALEMPEPSDGRTTSGRLGYPQEGC